MRHRSRDARAVHSSPSSWSAGLVGEEAAWNRSVTARDCGRSLQWNAATIASSATRSRATQPTPWSALARASVTRCGTAWSWMCAPYGKPFH